MRLGRREEKKVIRLLRNFREARHPHRGSLDERKQKFQELHDQLNELFFDRQVIKLKIEITNQEVGFATGYFSLPDDTIHLQNRLSVIMLLYLWGCALRAREFAYEVFAEVFPDHLDMVPEFQRWYLSQGQPR